MSPDQFEAALRQGPEVCWQTLAAATEAQRRSAAPVALRWHKRYRQARYGETVDGIAYEDMVRMVPLALLATATLSELRKLRCWVPSDDETLRWLKQRRPDWLQEWAGWALEQQPNCWPLIRNLMAAKLITKPATLSYTRALITGSQRRSVLQMLEGEPDLLEDIWALFEVEGDGEQSLAAYDKYMAQNTTTWNHALLKLGERGQLCRDRLLDASLHALARDFESFRAGWFSRFHEALQPTAEERAQRIDAYLVLLGSRVRPTVSFAVKALSQVSRSLRAPDLLAHIAPALHAREKGTVLGALKLLRQVVQEPSPRLSELLLEALAHESPDVQKALLEALQSYFPAPPPGAAPEVAASLRPVLDQWLGTPHAALPQAADFRSLQPPPEPGRTLVQWDSAMASWTRGEEPEPLCLPRTATPIVPVGNLEELVQVFSTVLETAGPPLQVDRVLEGVSRLCAERPPEFARLTGPLLKRAQQKLKKSKFGFTGHLREDLAALAVAWVERRLVSPHPEPAAGWRALLAGLFLELAVRAAHSESRPLRSFPDHPAGWIVRPPDGALTGDPVDLTIEQFRRESIVRSIDVQACLSEKDEWGHIQFRPEAAAQTPAGLYPDEQCYEAAELRWLSTLWPAGRHYWWGCGLERLTNNLDWWSAEWQNRVYLESLLDPEVALDPIACRLLAVGFSAKQPEEAGLAVDAANLGFQDGRLTATLLGESLASTWTFARPQRCAKNLAQLSAMHPYLTFRALEVLLTCCPLEDASLLQLVHELGAQLRMAVRPPAARQHLQSLTGGSKAGRLARQCLALAQESDRAIQEAGYASLEGRRQIALTRLSCEPATAECPRRY